MLNRETTVGQLDWLTMTVGEWAEKTFTQATDASICEHLRREVQELTDNPNSGEEMADVIMLVMHLAHRKKIFLELAVATKFYENTERKWGQPDKDGVVEHVT